ncbi:MAG: IS110 family transposase [Verrucomicrobia bacterium]|nr:IS110 family transposase [Verrucomicrobiota bacterium]
MLDDHGKIAGEDAVATSRESLEALSGRYPGAVIAMETGTHSPWVSRLFEAGGHRVYVANARKLRAISSSHTKSDQEDARMIARLARVDPALLSPVKHRSEAGQRAIIQIKVREALVRSRVNLMNSVRFLLKSLGVPMPSGVKAGSFVRKVRAVLDTPTCALVEPLLKMLEALGERIEACEEQLEKLAAERYPQAARLQQIPGVGPLTSLCFVATLENPARFKHARDVGAYLGLVPRRDQSGNTDKQLSITKAGNTALRCLLVNCAHYILGPFGPPSDLRAAGLRLCERGGKSAKKRAVIAIARKLAITLFALWKSGADYRPCSPTSLSLGLVPATAI